MSMCGKVGSVKIIRMPTLNSPHPVSVTSKGGFSIVPVSWGGKEGEGLTQRRNKMSDTVCVEGGGTPHEDENIKRTFRFSKIRMQRKDHFLYHVRQIFALQTTDIDGPPMGMKFIGLFSQPKSHGAVHNRTGNGCVVHSRDARCF